MGKYNIMAGITGKQTPVMITEEERIFDIGSIGDQNTVRDIKKNAISRLKNGKLFFIDSFGLLALIMGINALEDKDIWEGLSESGHSRDDVILLVDQVVRQGIAPHLLGLFSPEELSKLQTG